MRIMLALMLTALALFGARSESSAQEVSEPSALETITLPPELDRVLRDYEEAWRAGDEAQLASLFTEDGFVMSNGVPPVRGREAIAQQYAAFQGPLTLAALAYSTGDSVGYIVGTYGGSDPATHQGKYVLALRRDSTGTWLIAADMDNTNQR
jgi:ketosteroid isomerase-like protein